VTGVHDLTSDLNEKRLSQAFLYCSAYLLVSLTICCMISMSKNNSNIVQCHLHFDVELHLYVRGGRTAKSVTSA